MEVIQLDFREKIRGDEKGGNDFRKKENVRRGLLGKVEGSTYVGMKRAFKKDVDNGEG